MRNSSSLLNPIISRYCFHFIISLSAFFILYACKEKKGKDQTYKETSIEFKSKQIDFGRISEGRTVAKYYYFKNNGEHNLLIKNIEAGCGCTTVNYPQKPIAPEKDEKIEIIFNSSGRYGKQYKEISIFANIPEGKVIVSFTADIR